MHLQVIQEPGAKNLEPLRTATSNAVGRALALGPADKAAFKAGLKGNYYNPSPALVDAREHASLMTQLLWLAEKFTEINTSAIPAGGEMKAPDGTLTAGLAKFAPPVVQCLLCENSVSLRISAGYENTRLQANVPILPLSVTAYLSKVKENAPDAALHIAFEANWKPAPQGDPVVFARILNRDFKIAEWGGDVDIVAEFYTNA